MMNLKGMVRWLTIVFIFSSLMLAEGQEKVAAGRVVKVTCKDNAKQSYTCYLPKKYNAKKKWPILYCFAPTGMGICFVEPYKDVCEKNGWIVVGSNNSKNGPWEPVKEAMDAMWKDTHDRFSLDDRRCYASGFSGGSRAALELILAHPNNFCGLIPMTVATFSGKMTPWDEPPKHVAIYYLCGDKDPFLKDTESQAKQWKENGHPVEIKIFQGGHYMAPKELGEQAVEWMEKIWPEQKKKREEEEKAPKGKEAEGKKGEPKEAPRGDPPEDKKPDHGNEPGEKEGQKPQDGE